MMNNITQPINYSFQTTYCPCGIKIDGTSLTTAQQTIYDYNTGEVLYMKCIHGHVVIDKLKKGENEH